MSDACPAYAWRAAAPRRKEIVRLLILASVVILLSPTSSFAQSDRVYFGLDGGVAVGPDGHSRDVAAEAGIRLMPHVSILGSIGEFGNLRPSDLQPVLDETSQDLADSLGLHVVGTSRVPAWYSMGGLRADIPFRGRVSPYVTGSAGVARLRPNGQFTYSSGPLTNGDPIPGVDVTANVIALGMFTQPSPSNAFTFAFGTGATLQLDRHVALDAGYRFWHVAADTPLHAESVTVGLGYRF